MPLGLGAETLRFDRHDCALTLPDRLWTIDTSGSEKGILLAAFTEHRRREVWLSVADAPPGAATIQDSAAVEKIIAGLEGEGRRSGKGFHWIGSDLYYDLCFGRKVGNIMSGTG